MNKKPWWQHSWLFLEQAAIALYLPRDLFHPIFSRPLTMEWAHSLCLVYHKTPCYDSDWTTKVTWPKWANQSPSLGFIYCCFPCGSRCCLKMLEAISPTTWKVSTVGTWDNNSGTGKWKRERKRGTENKKRRQWILISVSGPDSCLSPFHYVRYPTRLSRCVSSFQA